jgi:hypothetical protein
MTAALGAANRAARKRVPELVPVSLAARLGDSIPVRDCTLDVTARSRQLEGGIRSPCVRRAVVDTSTPAKTAALGAANKAAKNDVPDLMPVSHDGPAPRWCAVASLACPRARPAHHAITVPLSRLRRWRRPLSWVASRSSPSVRVPVDIGHEQKPAHVRGAYRTDMVLAPQRATSLLPSAEAPRDAGVSDNTSTKRNAPLPKWSPLIRSFSEQRRQSVTSAERLAFSCKVPKERSD